MSRTETDLSFEDLRTLVGMRLKALRLDYKLNQQQAADALDIPRSSISGIERGKYVPHVFVLRHMCRFYNAPMDFLFTGKGLDRVLKTKLGTMAQRSMPVV